MLYNLDNLDNLDNFAGVQNHIRTPLPRQLSLGLGEPRAGVWTLFGSLPDSLSLSDFYFTTKK